MTSFKNNPRSLKRASERASELLPNLYYTDTDSAYLDGPLPDSLVDPIILG